jgi:hypothetical protein
MDTIPSLRQSMKHFIYLIQPKFSTNRGNSQLDWWNKFKYDPRVPLLESNNKAIVYFTKRDLLDQSVESIDTMWALKQPQTILKKQSQNGYWEHPGKRPDDRLLQTFKNIQILVYQYEFNRTHPSISGACEFLFSFQKEEGDIRGFIGNQYAPYYTGIVIALLIQAGYQDDPRIEKAMKWLLSMRQGDGGWVIGSPGLLGIPNLKWKDVINLTSDSNAETMKAFDWSQPFSHSGTGMVIRAFATHPNYQREPETIQAANLLKSHFFKEDNYNSYKQKDHWIRFGFPFWWNNLLSALDSLSMIGLQIKDPDIRNALDWFISHQQTDGLWKISYSTIHKETENSRSDELKLWISLAVCRVFKRFYG